MSLTLIFLIIQLYKIYLFTHYLKIDVNNIKYNDYIEHLLANTKRKEEVTVTKRQERQRPIKTFKLDSGNNKNK